jgi:hypothetical protein
VGREADAEGGLLANCEKWEVVGRVGKQTGKRKGNHRKVVKRW